MIVIPMAGLSSRFKKAGYNKPKFMLEAKGLSLFSHSVMSFQNYFGKEPFLFVATKSPCVEEFISSECRKIGLIDYKIVTLEKATRGQAETVYLGAQAANLSLDEPLLIFNIDTFRPAFEYPNTFKHLEVDGYLETFIGSGKNWSNVLPKHWPPNGVALTAEKQEISEYCCTGLYYWRRCSDYYRIFERYSTKNKAELQGGELYIAPMYNDLIEENKDVRFSVVERDSVIFCGIPEEYEEFVES